MSICVALNDGNGVWIGSDTMAVNCSVKERIGKKWVQCGRFWIGICGQVRAHNLVEAKAAEIATVATLSGVVETLRDILLADKWKTEDDVGQPPRFRSEFIITDGEKIVSVGGGFGAINCNFAAIGAGIEAALGARSVMAHMTWETENALVTMLAAAIEVNHNCGGEPWTFFVPKAETQDE